MYFKKSQCENMLRTERLLLNVRVVPYRITGDTIFSSYVLINNRILVVANDKDVANEASG